MCDNVAKKGVSMPAPKSEGVLEAERIYEQYVKPLENEHEGEYALVTPEGNVHFAPSMLEIAKKAYTMPSEKNLLFKVRDIVTCHIL